jgi:hypothetical protein
MTYREYTKLENLQSEYSDFYKEVYGFRPRFMSEEQWNSEEWFEAELKVLAERAKVVFAEEEAREQASIQQFEALVAKTIADGAKNRETALRWIMDGSDAHDDWDFLCYDYNLPYGYFKVAA